MMRNMVCILIALSVMGLAFWAYQENYRTKEAQTTAEQLQRQIGLARQRLRMLRSEWAYLNRPDRLRDLAEMNDDRLGLMPLTPDHFGRADQIAFPPDDNAVAQTEPLKLDNTVAAANWGADQ